jgi:hypothetical protein
MAGNGGKRPGAGRKKGSFNAKTLEQKAVSDAFNQRIMLHADALFRAQLALSVGSIKVFRIDESEDGNGKVKREHVLVTDSDEIKQVLDEHDGGSGVVGESYYFVTDVLPDNRALDSLLNRGLGKPKDSVDVNLNVSDLSDEELQAIAKSKG